MIPVSVNCYGSDLRVPNEQYPDPRGIGRPDVPTDRQRLQDVRSGQLWKWRELELEELHDAGQHEFLNWICLAGAMEGPQPDRMWYSEAHIFNSDRVVAIFPPAPSGELQLRTNRPELAG